MRRRERVRSADLKHDEQNNLWKQEVHEASVSAARPSACTEMKTDCLLHFNLLNKSREKKTTHSGRCLLDGGAAAREDPTPNNSDGNSLKNERRR